MKIVGLLRLITVLPLAGLIPQTMPIMIGYRSGYPASPYLLYDNNGIFDAFADLSSSINTLIARFCYVIRHMASYIFRAPVSALQSFIKLPWPSLCSVLAVIDIKSTLTSALERIKRVTTKIFTSVSVVIEKIEKTEEAISKGNESNKKDNVIKMNIFTQNISTGKDFVINSLILKIENPKNVSAENNSAKNIYKRINFVKNNYAVNSFAENVSAENNSTGNIYARNDSAENISAEKKSAEKTNGLKNKERKVSTENISKIICDNTSHKTRNDQSRRDANLYMAVKLNFKGAYNRIGGSSSGVFSAFLATEGSVSEEDRAGSCLCLKRHVSKKKVGKKSFNERTHNVQRLYDILAVSNETLRY